MPCQWSWLRSALTLTLTRPASHARRFSAHRTVQLQAKADAVYLQVLEALSENAAPTMPVPIGHSVEGSCAT